MSSVVISGDTSGAVTLTVPAVAGTRTATLPAATGTVMVSGNMPAFAAYISTQSISADTLTKMAYDNKFFDTASCYNNTGSTVGGIPAYSFLPNVAGYYQVSMSCYFSGYAATGFVGISIGKNGTTYCEVQRVNIASGVIGGAGLVYLNGTTDYLSGYFYAANNNGTTLVSNNGSVFSNLSAALVRGA
jgi:hypothetical protein